jgi:hypothetical protein
MFFSYKQHKVLKEILKNYNDKSHTTSDIQEAGKSLSSEELHRRTSYSLDDVNLIISSLLDGEYIEPFKLYGKGEILFYGITNRGKSAVANNTFVWYYKTENIINLVTLLIALFGLFNSIFSWVSK